MKKKKTKLGIAIEIRDNNYECLKDGKSICHCMDCPVPCYMGLNDSEFKVKLDKFIKDNGGN